MKRLLFPAFAVAAGLLALAACDPDLTPHTVPGDVGAEGGGPVVSPEAGPSAEGGPSSEGGPEEGGADAGPTHKVDGINDFAAGEKLDTTSTKVDPTYHAYAAWDAKNLYFGMEGNDIKDTTPNKNNKWVLVYIGRDATPGSTKGLPYNGTTQQATLPFPASINLRWKVSGDFGNVQQWNAGATKWEDAPLVPLTVVRQGSFVEMSVARTAIGAPTKIQVTMNMLIENGNDFTYAGVPSTSFTDSLNPTFTTYYEFDLSDLAKAPSSYAPKP